MNPQILTTQMIQMKDDLKKNSEYRSQNAEEMKNKFVGKIKMAFNRIFKTNF